MALDDIIQNAVPISAWMENVFAAIVLAVMVVGCGSVGFLKSPSRKAFGITDERVEAIYGFAALVTIVVMLGIGYEVWEDTSHIADQDALGILIAAVLLGLAVFGVACFVGIVIAVLYYASIERPRARRLEQESNEARRRQDLEAAQRRAEEAEDRARARVNSVKRERRLFDLELIYNYCEHQIANRFPEAEFERFVGKYLGADVSDEEFFARADQLQTTIERYADEMDPAEQKMTLEDATAWYTERKSQIGGLPVDDNTKEDFVLQLNERYAELCQRLMSDVRTT